MYYLLTGREPVPFRSQDKVDGQTFDKSDTVLAHGEVMKSNLLIRDYGVNSLRMEEMLLQMYVVDVCITIKLPNLNNLVLKM